MLLRVPWRSCLAVVVVVAAAETVLEVVRVVVPVAGSAWLWANGRV